MNLVLVALIPTIGLLLFFSSTLKLQSPFKIVESSRVSFEAKKSGRLPSSRICPRVFMYDIDALLPHPDARTSDRGQSDRLYPDPFGLPISIMGPGWYQTRHKSACTIFHRTLINYGDLCLTDNPAEAEIFYIPYYRDWYCGIRPCNWWSKDTVEERNLFEFIGNQTKAIDGVDYFQRHSGADHLLVGCCDHLHRFVSKDQKWLLGNWRNVITAFGVGNPTFSIPFPSSFHLDTQVSASDLPWQSKHLMKPPKFLDEDFLGKFRGPEQNNISAENVIHHQPPRYERRPVFVAFAVGDVGGVRNALVRECESYNDPLMCQIYRTQRDLIMKNNSTSDSADNLDQIFFSINELYGKSVFCLNPPGDNCSRRAIFDSLLNGCIPVVIQPCPMELYRDFIDTQKSMIFIPWKFAIERKLITYLQGIPEHTIREMQIYISQNAHRAQFSNLKSRDELESIEKNMQHLVHDDAFFHILNTAAKILEQYKVCEALGGHYQNRYRVCCSKTNDCNPMGLAAEGMLAQCKVRQQPPCAFSDVLLYHMEAENPPGSAWNDDRVSWGDHLREPRPFILPKFRNRTTESGW